MENEKVFCDFCGREIVGNAINITVDGEYVTLCHSCFDDDITECERCGEYVRTVDTYTVLTDSRGNLEEWCESCRSDYASFCYECSAIVSDEITVYYDGEYYCPNCAESLSRCRLDDYGVTVANHFYGESLNGLYLGVELEVDTDEETAIENKGWVVETIRNYFGDFVQCKYDGSLDNGFEVASQPATLAYHLYANHNGNGNPWEKIRKFCLDGGFTSHDAQSCGLHVHVSRSYFEDDTDAVMKLWAIIDNNRQWFTTFSRRSEYHLNRWAEFKSHTRVKDKKWLCSDVEWEKGRGHISERYQAINNTNPDTIEFRLFRGTLRQSTFNATLFFVAWLCEYVNTKTDYECDSLDLSKVDFPEIVKVYLSERGL